MQIFCSLIGSKFDDPFIQRNSLPEKAIPLLKVGRESSGFLQDANLIGEYLPDLEMKEKLPTFRPIKPDGSYTVPGSNTDSKEVVNDQAL